MFEKVLIANRGEIAVRVIRACKDLGIGAVAVFSDADRLSPHVLEADEAYHIGEAASSKSYLLAHRIIEVARAAGCDAVHPGYGFLAERAGFASGVVSAGLSFIGPTPAAIAAMGDKTEARRRMMSAGVPVVPGTTQAAADAGAALRAAEDIGFPVLLKAAAGGGGKGMRVVREPAELPRAFDSATHEADGAFGDGTLYLEKYLDRPRHIEVQVLADQHGAIVHLGERECSIQRRHQKMIEEAPSPVITPELRDSMGHAAVAAASAVDYRNAGTIEFLYQDGNFYFLEMNTRIQVEHPVTELITGIDLVEWQIRIAAGEPLNFTQEDVRWHGHALECRITSENPREEFLPSTGRIELLEVPAGPGIRWDGGIAQGYEISLYYDPMLAKLIAHGPDRASAIARMSRALSELRIVGVETSADLHARVMREPDFLAGDLDIRYLDNHPSVIGGEPTEEELRAAALSAALLEEERRRRRAVTRVSTAAGRSAWREVGWR